MLTRFRTAFGIIEPSSTPPAYVPVATNEEDRSDGGTTSPTPADGGRHVITILSSPERPLPGSESPSSSDTTTTATTAAPISTTLGNNDDSSSSVHHPSPSSGLGGNDNGHDTGPIPTATSDPMVSRS